MTKVEPWDSDGWERGGAQGRMLCSSLCLWCWSCRESSEEELSQLNEDVAFQCTNAPPAGGNPASRFNWYSNISGAAAELRTHISNRTWNIWSTSSFTFSLTLDYLIHNVQFQLSNGVAGVITPVTSPKPTPSPQKPVSLASSPSCSHTKSWPSLSLTLFLPPIVVSNRQPCS